MCWNTLLRIGNCHPLPPGALGRVRSLLWVWSWTCTAGFDIETIISTLFIFSEGYLVFQGPFSKIVGLIIFSEGYLVFQGPFSKIVALIMKILPHFIITIINIFIFVIFFWISYGSYFSGNIHVGHRGRPLRVLFRFCLSALKFWSIIWYSYPCVGFGAFDYICFSNGLTIIRHIYFIAFQQIKRFFCLHEIMICNPCMWAI